MKKVIVYNGVQAPNSSSFATVYTPSNGQSFRLEEMIVICGTNVDLDLEIALYHGTKQVIPEYGVISGKEGRIPIKCEWTWNSGEPIRLFVKNTHTTNTYKYSIILIGDLG